MSGKTNRRRGFGYERELVAAAERFGIPAKRAWGSDGRAIGESCGVDAVIGGYRVQAKRRKKIAAWLKPPTGCDVVATREDRGESFVVVPLPLWLRMVRESDR